MRPRVFIGSSSSPDRMQTTKALAHRLQKEFRIIPKEWPYLFPPTESTLGSIIDMSREMDFAIFVLGPDDLILKSPTSNPQGKGVPVEGETWTPRDNVIFEMGLLIGALGKERCFAVVPESRPLRYSDEPIRLHMFTDYLGTTYCTYMATKEPGLDPLDAVFAACQEIGNQIEKLGPRPINAFRALFGSKSQAVVVYPHIKAVTEGIYTTEHLGGSRGERKHYWREPVTEHDMAHFDDLRAVNAIAELCGRMQVNVVATTDGSEQAQIQSLDTISFSIGLLNGLTNQAFEIIASDTDGGICLDNQTSGGEERPETNSVILFNGYRYPESPHQNYAILVRTFLRGSGNLSIPRFICGGIEAPGTAAAGVFLKNNWKDILKFYEDFGKDLEEHSLAVILQFWGRKPESARPEAIRISFFQPGCARFYAYDLSTKGWIPEEKKPETEDQSDPLQSGATPPNQEEATKQTQEKRANASRPKSPRRRG